MKHIVALCVIMLCAFIHSFAGEYTINTFTAPNKYIKEVLGDGFHLSEAELFVEVAEGTNIIYRTKGQDILGDKDLYYFNENFSSNADTLLFSIKVGIRKGEERAYRAGAGAGGGATAGAIAGGILASLFTGGLGAPAGAAIGAALGGSAGAATGALIPITDAHTVTSYLLHKNEIIGKHTNQCPSTSILADGKEMTLIIK